MAESPLVPRADDPSNDPSSENAGKTSGITATAPREPHLRTQFLRRIAHDIASPTGVATTVLDEIAQSGAARPELLAMARRSLRRLMRLSDQLALVAELEGSPLEPELVEVDLRGIVQKAWDDALAIDARRDVVASGPELSEPRFVRADARLLTTALREVFGNALRAACGRVEVSVEGEGGDVVVLCEDDGPGFSAEALENLGARFLPRPATRGLGLSLSIALDALRTHGGTLEIADSRLPPGRRGVPGAAVRITLPLADGGTPPANASDR